jgi:hypothetical protein
LDRFSESLDRPLGRLQGTFSVHSGKFREHSGNIQGIFREIQGNSVNI